MKLNVDAMKKLMKERYNNNYNAFSRATGVNIALLYRILNEQCGDGVKTLNLVMDFFKSNDLVYVIFMNHL